MSDKPAASTKTGGVMTRSQAVFIGVGAMVGAGIFTLLGEAGKIAQSAVWLSFLAAGLIAMLQAYSSVYLGKKYASSAGLVGYIGAGFGRAGRVTSTLAWVVWASTIIVIAMVATSFGTYGTALFTAGGGSLPTSSSSLRARSCWGSSFSAPSEERRPSPRRRRSWCDW